MSNGLFPQYVSLNPGNYGWKLCEDAWEPICFEDEALPNPDELDSNCVEPQVEEQENIGNYSGISDSEESSGDSDYIDSCSDSDHKTIV